MRKYLYNKSTNKPIFVSLHSESFILDPKRVRVVDTNDAMLPKFLNNHEELELTDKAPEDVTGEVEKLVNEAVTMSSLAETAKALEMKQNATAKSKIDELETIAKNLEKNIVDKKQLKTDTLAETAKALEAQQQALTQVAVESEAEVVEDTPVAVESVKEEIKVVDEVKTAVVKEVIEVTPVKNGSKNTNKKN